MTKGNAFSASFEKFAAQDGVQVVQKIMYTPGQPDYASEVAQLSRAVAASGATAIAHLGQEVDDLNIYTHASQDPVLSNVQWYIDDTPAGAPFYPPNAPESIPKWMMKVNMTGEFTFIPNNERVTSAVARFKAETGRDPFIDMIYDYDSCYLGSMAMVLNQNDGVTIQQTLPTIAGNYYGVTGPKTMDANGDLAAISLQYWMVVYENGKYSAKQVGLYEAETGLVQITIPPSHYLTS